MSTDTGAGLTVTPIFWEPLGRRFVFPPKYESIIDSYVSNVAAASGSTDNVYSVDTEYYDMADGAESYIKYDIHAGGPVVDTDAFPPYNCSPAPGYTACITDLQLKAELRLITSDLRLPTNLAHFYPVFFPPGVETVDIDGSNSYDGFCGYHRAFGPNGDKTVYADMPVRSDQLQRRTGPERQSPGRRGGQHSQPRAERSHYRPARIATTPGPTSPATRSLTCATRSTGALSVRRTRLTRPAASTTR